MVDYKNTPPRALYDPYEPFNALLRGYTQKKQDEQKAQAALNEFQQKIALEQMKQGGQITSPEGQPLTIGQMTDPNMLSQATVKIPEGGTSEMRLKDAEKRRQAKLLIDNLDEGTIFKKNDPVVNTYKEWGIDPDALVEAGRAKKSITSDGDIVYKVIPKKTFDEKISQKYLDTEERKAVDGLLDENIRWDTIVNKFAEIGITKETASNFDSLGNVFKVGEWQTVMSELGPISIPAKIKIVGEYAKDPRYGSVKNLLEQSFNEYRKRITGAQAAMKELTYLRNSFPKLTQNPSVMFELISDMRDMNYEILDNKLDVYQTRDRDVTALRELINKRRSVTVAPKEKKANGNKSDPLGLGL